MISVGNNVIAVVTEGYTDYQKYLIDLIAARCAQLGYGCLCLTGDDLSPASDKTNAKSVSNSIYRLSTHQNIVGTIILAGTVAGKVSGQEVVDFIDTFPAPKVCFGLEVPNVPSVIVDDAPAMWKLMNHLTEDPAVQNFVFVRGLLNDPYSQQRETIFRQALASANRTVDESLFVTGDYDSTIAYQAVSKLLDQRGDSIDAIVAANDAMALGTARAAAAHGLEIPHDITVTGFDDTEEATRFSPALTTVRQPLIEMVDLSVNWLHDLIVSNHPAANQHQFTQKVSSELVIRGSSTSDHRGPDKQASYAAGSLADSIAEALQAMDLPCPSAKQMLLDLAANIHKDNGLEFCNVLAEQAFQTLRPASLHAWSSLTHTLHTLCMNMQTENDALVPTELLICVAQLKEKILSLKLEREFQVRRMHKAQSDLQLQISSCTNTADVVSTVHMWLESVQPKRFFLIGFDSPMQQPGPAARLLHAYHDGKVNKISSQPFQTQNLLPPELDQELSQGLLILTPIVAGDRLFGYFLLDPAELETVELRVTAMCLGNAMRNQFLMQSLQDKSENLRLANAELTQLARYDAVTGLGNRLSFQWSLQKLLDESLNTKDRVCLFFIDLDGFKGINDLLGHAAGDQMLCQVASSLNTLTSKYRNVGMTAFRLGGDEFTLTLRLSDNEQLAEDVGQEVLHRLAKPMTLNDGDHTISASVGYAISSKDCCDTDVLTRQADTAMYRAKKAGKNRLVKYIEERPKHARSPIALVKPSGENPPSHETDDDTSLDWLDPPRSASNDR